MANPTVRAFPVYYKGRKIATAYENDYKTVTGRTRLVGAEGYLCHSKGAIFSNLSIKYIQPVTRLDVNIVLDCLAQEDIKIGIPVGGKIHQITMAITENSMTSNAERGTVEGSLMLEGGKPEVT